MLPVIFRLRLWQKATSENTSNCSGVTETRCATELPGKRTEEKMEDQKIKITLIAACRNEIKHIRGFLDSALTQDMTGISWEGIIAYAMSQDGPRGGLDAAADNH